MEKDLIVTENDLPPKGQEEKKPDIKKVVKQAVWVLVFLMCAFVFSYSSQIMYAFARYKSFYVNGASMYPLLNSSVTFIDTDGNRHDGSALSSWGDFTSPGEYHCDYGIMDQKNGFLSKIKRFDVVCSYYPSDYEGSGKLKANASLKIKRVLALPGESIKFDEEGQIYIKGVGEDDYSPEPIPQDFYSESFLMENPDWIKDTYEESSFKDEMLAGYEMGNDGYFLCGDNRLRSASNDSRAQGPIKAEYIVGKAIALVGKCRYNLSSDGSASIKANLASIIFPWEVNYIPE